MLLHIQLYYRPLLTNATAYAFRRKYWEARISRKCQCVGNWSIFARPKCREITEIV